jgi:hypothetical protein
VEEMNRETFVTLNRTRLFTADQVVDIAQAEREKVLDEVCCKIRKYYQNRIWLGAERLITHIRQGKGGE